MKIPVIMMFNDNYSIPSGVAILSLLTNAKRNHFYELYILHNDISETHQNMIKTIVSKFENAKLELKNMHNKLRDISIQNYPTELLYKFCLPSIFPNLDYAIVTDVDVVFVDDISAEFCNFVKTENYYFAGVKQIQEINHSKFSLNIRDNNMHYLCGAGYMIYNLSSMRLNNIEEKCIEYYKQNQSYCKYPDQDVLNQVCYPNIKLIHSKNMMLTTLYKNKEKISKDKLYSYTANLIEVEEALQNPVQLHYVESENIGKPWFDVFAPKAEYWWSYVVKIPFYNEAFQRLLKYQIGLEKSKYNHFIEYIFSSKELYENNIERKCVTILGFKIKLKKNYI